MEYNEAFKNWKSAVVNGGFALLLKSYSEMREYSNETISPPFTTVKRVMRTFSTVRPSLTMTSTQIDDRQTYLRLDLKCNLTEEDLEAYHQCGLLDWITKRVAYVNVIGLGDGEKIYRDRRVRKLDVRDDSFSIKIPATEGKLLIEIVEKGGLIAESEIDI